MRQLAIIVCLVATLVLWGCGGKKKTPVTPPAKVTVDVSGLSLNFGEISTLSSSQVHTVDANGNVLTNGPTFTVSSSNTSLVTINNISAANTAEICAGVFNANATVCNGNSPPLTAGTANITVSAQGVSSDPIPVSVHPRVTSAAVLVDANPAPVCTSQNATLHFKLIACNGGAVVNNQCSGGTDVSGSLGTITWNTSDNSIASAASDGTVTSKLPGAVNVTAIIGAVNQVNPTPAVFVACPPQTISIHVTGVADTTFALDPTASTPVTSVKLDADVADTLGQPITGAMLTWSSFTPASASVGTDGTVTAVAAGRTSIVASCTPPTCNKVPALTPSPLPAGSGSPVYSNLVTGSVAGTSTPTVYATAPTTDGTAAGTANMMLLVIPNPADLSTIQSVTLPHPANSMVFDPAGAKAYLGTADDHGLMIFDPNNPTTAPTVVGDGTITGKVIGVSHDGTRVVVSNTSAGKVFVYNTSATTNNIETFTLSNVSGADFAGDNSKGLLSSTAAGSSLFYVPGGGTRAISPVGNDVKFLPQGSVAYFGGTSITGISGCSTSTQVKTVDTKNNAVNVWGVATDGTHLIGASSGNWVDLAPTADPRAVPPAPCPSQFTSSVTTPALPAFAGTPTQILVRSDSKKAFMTGFSVAQGQTVSGIPAYDLTTATGSVIPGISSPAVSGGIALDGSALYVGVGGSAPGVYKVDLTANSPTAAALAIPSSSLTFVPSIVTVRPK